MLSGYEAQLRIALHFSSEQAFLKKFASGPTRKVIYWRRGSGETSLLLK